MPARRHWNCLPRKIQPTLRAFGLVMGNVFDEPKEPTQQISGLAVSPGIYEGTAKVILSTRDFDRLEKGDILVTKNTSAGFQCGTSNHWSFGHR